MSPAYYAATHLVCRCLQVTADEVVEAIEQHDLQSVREVVRCTGAGSGCNACHRLIRQYLAQQRAVAVAGQLATCPDAA
jgi:NAD(P)H-nitrite reductase large subunit